MSLDDFFHQPYEERQLILFSDIVSKPTVKGIDTAIKELTANYQKEPLKYLPLLAGLPIFGIAGSLTGIPAVAEIRLILKEVLTNKEKITYMPTIMAQELALPLGNVKEGEIYIGHPIESQYKSYFPNYDFHLSLHRQKSRELVRILRSLQLTHFRFRHVEGYRDMSRSSMDFSAKIDGVKVGGGGGQKNEASCDYEVIWEETYAPTNEKPILPDGLIWFDHEDEWQLAIEGALQERMKSMKFKYSYKNDFGVDIDWNLVLDKAKVKTKTQKQEFQRTEWEVIIER